MVDPTLIAFANNTAPLVIQASSTTNWPQFTLSLITLLITSFGVLLLFSMPNGGIRALIAKQKLTTLTERPTHIIKHNLSGLFDSQMIDQKTTNKLAKFLNKHEKEEVNIILHTPGGTIFHSMACSDLIKNHGKVHVYVPLMAMSGGTLLSMSAQHLYMGPSAALGPIDPQLGLIWTQGSADDWKTVIKAKGKTAGDTAHIMHNEGKKYTTMIAQHLEKLGLDKNVVKELSAGKAPHSKRYNAHEVATMHPNGVLLMGAEANTICIKATT